MDQRPAGCEKWRPHLAQRGPFSCAESLHGSAGQPPTCGEADVGPRLATRVLRPRPALPDAEDVAGWLAEGGLPQISLGIRRRYHRTAMGEDLLECVVEALDVDVWADAGFGGDGQFGHEMADHMPAAVLEAWIRAVRVHG